LQRANEIRRAQALGSHRARTCRHQGDPLTASQGRIIVSADENLEKFSPKSSKT
jgi:hypothetical protein